MPCGKVAVSAMQIARFSDVQEDVTQNDLFQLVYSAAHTKMVANNSVLVILRRILN